MIWPAMRSMPHLIERPFRCAKAEISATSRWSIDFCVDLILAFSSEIFPRRPGASERINACASNWALKDKVGRRIIPGLSRCNRACLLVCGRRATSGNALSECLLKCRFSTIQGLFCGIPRFDQIEDGGYKAVQFVFFFCRFTFENIKNFHRFTSFIEGGLCAANFRPFPAALKCFILVKSPSISPASSASAAVNIAAIKQARRFVGIAPGIPSVRPNFPASLHNVD